MLLSLLTFLQDVPSELGEGEAEELWLMVSLHFLNLLKSSAVLCSYSKNAETQLLELNVKHFCNEFLGE